MDSIKRAIAAFFDFLQGIVVVAAVMVMIYLFIMSPQEINGASMEPSFHNGEYILTNKISYKFAEPKRGDVIIFKSPKNKDIDYIKRVIAVPGETVSLKNNTIFVNEEPLPEQYLTPGTVIFGASYLRENGLQVIPAGRYFVLGDNRSHSSDSREFGPIPLNDIIGKAILRYWPFDKTGLIGQPTYSLP